MKKMFKVISITVLSSLAAFFFYNGFIASEPKKLDDVIQVVGEFLGYDFNIIDPEDFARNLVKNHRDAIERCQAKDREAMEAAVRSLHSYFDQKYNNVDPMLDELFSLTSKGKIAYYYAADAFGDKKRVDSYINQVSREYLGDPHDLKLKMDSIIYGLKKDLLRNHAELMLELEEVLLIETAALNLSGPSIESINEEFRTAFDNNLGRTLSLTLGSEALLLAVEILVIEPVIASVAAFVTEFVTVQAAALAAEGAAVGTGAALGPETLGISIAVGILVAAAIDWAVGKVAKADARKEVIVSLDRWKSGTISSFKAGSAEGLTRFNETRRRALVASIAQTVATATR